MTYIAGGDSTFDLDGWRYHLVTSTGQQTLQVAFGGDVEYAVIAAGGGSKFTNSQGGGGAGGAIVGTATVSPGDLAFTVGAAVYQGNGEDTVAFGQTAVGGGASSGNTDLNPANDGGSGGGGYGLDTFDVPRPGGAGTSGQGNVGGAGNEGSGGFFEYTGGGGGYGGPGADAVAGVSAGGLGGLGLEWPTGSGNWYAAGGSGRFVTARPGSGTANPGGGVNYDQNMAGDGAVLLRYPVPDIEPEAWPYDGVAVQPNAPKVTIGLGPLVTVTDVTPVLTSVSIRRGRPDEQSRFQVGTCQIVMRNDDGVFEPDRVWFEPEVRRPLTVYYLDDADAEHPLFVGVVDSVDYNYELDGTSTVTVTAVDRMALLAGTALTDVSFVEQLAGARVSAVLNNAQVNYTGATDIDVGVQTVAAQADVSGNTLEYLQQVVTYTERGFLFVDRAGTLTFRDRDAALNDPGTVTLSDGGDVDSVGFVAIARSTGSRTVYNRLTAETVAETRVTVEDASSQSTYGIRTLDLGQVVISSTSELTTLLNFILATSKDPQDTFPTVTIIVDDQDDTIRQALLDLDLTDIVNVRFTTPYDSIVSVKSVIRQVEHRASIGRPWRMTLALTAADDRPFLVYADTTADTNDRWDENVWSL